MTKTTCFWVCISAPRVSENAEEAAPLKFLFVTPEKIGASESLLSLFDRLDQAGRLCRFVIDEAHCVSQWGNDFRPDYTKLKYLRDRKLARVWPRSYGPLLGYPRVPILALTASATVDILEDVISSLGMRNAQIFRSSFDRPNLKWVVTATRLAAGLRHGSSDTL